MRRLLQYLPVISTAIVTVIFGSNSLDFSDADNSMYIPLVFYV